MTSTARSNASGNNHSAQAVPSTVKIAVAEKMPVVETPVLASAPALSDPRRIPVKTQVFSNAITDPRRSCGARHWISALSGTKIKALDVPRIDCVIVETPVPNVPYGVRGVGEVPIVPPAACVANAIARATGVRLTRMPMTPERVLRALRGA